MPWLAFAAAAVDLRPFNVPAGPAAERLLQFSEQAGVQVLFSTETLRDIETKAAEGDLAPRLALERMFAGTGASVAVDEATGTLQVRRATSAPAAPVVLPPMSVTSRGQPWRFAETAGFTFLSHCSDAVTKGYLQGMNRALRVLELLVPPEFLLKSDVPQIIILSPDGQGSSSMSQNLLNNFSSAPEAPRSALPVNLLNPDALDRLDRMVQAQTALRIVRDMELIDKDRTAAFTAVHEPTFDGDKLFVRPAHFEYLLEARRPALPAWLVAGVMKLYGDERIVLQPTGIQLPPLQWLSPPETRMVGTDARRRAEALLPMDEFMKAPASGQRDAQAALFVRWSVDSWGHGRESAYAKSARAEKGGRTAQPNREAFWKFVARAAAEPVSEAMFQECFGFGSAEMRSRLTDYLRDAVRAPVKLRLAASPEVPLPALRDATPFEVARIKGDWERLTTGFVKIRHPQYAQSYAFQARATLMQAYRDGVRDAGALAVIGLYECNQGNDEAARPFLEAAAAANVIRPQAYYELARLRYAEAKEKPAGRQQHLSAEQANHVLEPLRAGHLQSPPLREIYDLAAVVWSNSDVALTRRELGLLDEGLRFFPRDADLYYKAALVNAVQGFKGETAKLVERALRIAGPADDHGRFLDLLTKVEPDNAMMPVESFRFAERRTPKAAFEVIVWASTIGADAALGAALSVTGETRDRANALVRELSGAPGRSAYSSPEKLAALSYKNLFKDVTSIQVLDQAMEPDGPVNLGVRLRRKDDTIETVTFAFQMGPGGWQHVVPDRQFERVRAQLADRVSASLAKAGGRSGPTKGEPDVLVVADLMGPIPDALRPEPGKPVYYNILSQRESDIGSIVVGDPKPDPAVIEREVVRALAEQGFMQTGPRGPRASLAIVIEWGSANLDVDEYTVIALPPPDFAHGSKQDAGESRPPPPETETRQVVYNKREIMMLVGADKANAQVMNPRELELINDAMRERRSYIFVGAFDAALLAKKQSKLLWRTRMSIGSLNHSLPESIASMLASGAPHFGQDLERPVFISERDRKAEVQVGTPTVVPDSEKK